MTYCRETLIVKRRAKRPSLVKREAYLADNDSPDCERRDTRNEIRTTFDQSRMSAQEPLG